MIITHKNKNDDHNNSPFSLCKSLCRLHNFPFTTNYNYVEPKNHYEVAEKRPDGTFNCLVGVINHFVKAIKYSVEAINHLDEAINHLDEAINRLDEAIKYNLLHISTLQPHLKTIRRPKSLALNSFWIEY